MKEALVQARIGQGAYRADLMKVWNDRCAVTACAIPEMLRASHVKTWRVSDNAERLDSENGLILSARGSISSARARAHVILAVAVFLASLLMTFHTIKALIG